MRRLIGKGREEDGFTLIEVVITLGLMSVALVALAHASTTGARMLVQSRQRQVATQQASAHLEHIRDMAYANVALSSQPAHSTDAKDPDFYVSSNGLTYDHSKDGAGNEDLVVDATAGQVVHTESLTVGTTPLTIYQYVTWVDDPNVGGTQDYKRVVVVAAFSSAQNPGRPHTVAVSALMTEGSVTIGGTQSGAQSGASPSATPTPTPTSTASGSCEDDDDAPTGTFTILSGTGSQTGFTASPSVTITVAPADACTPISVQFSNDNVTFGSAFEYNSGSPTSTWALESGNGLKNVWAKFTDGVGNSGTVGPQSITLDQTAPTAPGTLTRTADCTGNDRTVNLSWGVSTDTNLVGYRVYKNTNDAGWVALSTTASLSSSDTDLKTLNSLSYKVVAYDKAGNEGPASNVVTLSKNQCS